MVPYTRLTLAVIEVLERLEIPYMVVGSVAAAAHGISRGTRDVDLVADLREGDGTRLARELGPDYYFDVEMAEESIRRKSSLSTIYTPEVFKVDIFVLRASQYEHQAFARRIKVPLEPGSPHDIYVQSAEDTILGKLKWYRMGGEASEVQWRDVLGMLSLKRGSLDEEYLRRWAEQERVLDLLERAQGQLRG